MKTITTTCPGCSIGCGLYLVESESAEGQRLSVAHRKVAPMNEGKLCKFGMRLPFFYAKEPQYPSVDGVTVEQEVAVEEATKRLKSLDPAELAFVALPSTISNEEILSLATLAYEFGCEDISFGFEQFFRGIPEEAFYVIENGLPFAEVEQASKIVLFFIDPFVNYPLLARRIIKAKEHGAPVIDVSFALNERGIADESILVEPKDIGRLKAKREFFEDSLIISELTPYTDPYVESMLLWLQATTKSRVFLLKPFLNATGALLLSRSGNSKGAGKRNDLFEILDGIENGDIRGLYLLETDLARVLGNGEELRKTLAHLDVLVEQTAFPTSMSEITHITLPSEPFYMKRGTVVTIEGRLLELGGDSASGVQILERMGLGRSYEDVHAQVRSRLGLGDSEPSEFEIAIKRKEQTFEVAFLMDFIKTFLSLLKLENEEEGGVEDEYVLWYKTNPFFWAGIQDKQFVEISPAAMRALGLYSGDEVELLQDKRVERVGFKIADIPDDLILSEDKLALPSMSGRWVDSSRRALLTRVEMKKAGQGA